MAQQIGEETVFPATLKNVSEPNAKGYVRVEFVEGGTVTTDKAEFIAELRANIGRQGHFRAATYQHQSSKGPFTQTYLRGMQFTDQQPAAPQMPAQGLPGVSPQMPTTLPTPPSPAPAPQAEKFMSRRDPREVEDIHKQVALKAAVDIANAKSFRVEVSTLGDLMLLAKAIKSELEADWDEPDSGFGDQGEPWNQPGDDDIPF